MIHILVVDDEPHIAHGIGNLLQEAAELDARVWKAMSVKEAVAVFQQHRIDLLITDIQMPGKTGLELVELVIRQWQRCKVIFLTGYSDFEYMQFAVRNEVFEYLLKPIEDSELLAAVCRAVEKISVEFDKEAWKRRAELQLQSAKPLMIRELVEHVLSGEPRALLRLDEQLYGLGVELATARPVLLMVGRVSSWPDDYLPKDKLLMEYAITNIVEEYLSADNRMVASKHGNYLLWLFQPVDELPGQAEELLHLQIRETVEAIQNTVREMLQLQVSFVLAPELTSWSGLPAVYQQMVAMLKGGIGLEEEILVAGAGWPPAAAEARLTTGAIGQSVRLLEACLEQGDVAGAVEELQQFFRRMEQSVFVDYGLQMEAYCALSLALIRYVNDKGIRAEVSEQFDLDALINYSKLDNMKNWERLYIELLHLIFRIVRQKGSDLKFDISNAIDDYIANNLHGDLSLTQLAKQVHLSPHYLSRLYFNERGYNLSEKITTLRIRKAKEMLGDGKLKIYEIAARLGFDNVPYFSRFFKKQVGKTPQEYKESNRIS